MPELQRRQLRWSPCPMRSTGCGEGPGSHPVCRFHREWIAVCGAALRPSSSELHQRASRLLRDPVAESEVPTNKEAPNTHMASANTTSVTGTARIRSEAESIMPPSIRDVPVATRSSNCATSTGGAASSPDPSAVRNAPAIAPKPYHIGRPKMLTIPSPKNTLAIASPERLPITPNSILRESAPIKRKGKDATNRTAKPTRRQGSRKRARRRASLPHPRLPGSRPRRFQP